MTNLITEGLAIFYYVKSTEVAKNEEYNSHIHIILFDYSVV